MVCTRPGGVGLHAHDLGHALFELSGVQVVARRLDAARPRRRAPA